MDGPTARDVAELGELANKKMGGGVAEVLVGPMRLNGQDRYVAVARTEYEDERGLVYMWVDHVRTWRPRRDVDPDEATGLIEWRRQRSERDGE